MHQSETDMTELIFAATERLMARDGLNNLSMHKIAKEAKISAGTIYLYFKNKDELLEQFARRIFTIFSQAMTKNCDKNLPYFEQYRIMWWNIWRHLEANPMLTSNMHQYQALPHFAEICEEWEQHGAWTLFCQNAVQAGILCNLPTKVLFALGLESAINLAFGQVFFKRRLSDEVLEQVIERTWRSIQK